MKRLGLLIICCLVSVPALVGCGSKLSSPNSGKTDDAEAQRVAEKFADLLVSKCGPGCLFAGQPPTSMKGFGVKAVEQMHDDDLLHSEEHFLGYEWKGHVIISEDGGSSGTGFPIYKRTGKWFYHTRGEDGDVPIDMLQSVRPECPK